MSLRSGPATAVMDIWGVMSGKKKISLYLSPYLSNKKCKNVFKDLFIFARVTQERQRENLPLSSSLPGGLSQEAGAASKFPTRVQVPS